MSLNIHPRETAPDVFRERMEIAEKLEKLLANDKNWYEFPTPQDYRDARRDGTNGFKKPVLSEHARLVNCGFVIGSNAGYDTYLTRLSNELGITLASVEYRLAPEHPHPAGYHDAIDAALFALSTSGARELGGPLRVLGGESAGAWFSVGVALALRDHHGIDVRSQLSAICAGYGIFDLTYTPSCLSHKRNIVLSSDLTRTFMEATFGHIPVSERKNAEISPLYADLRGLPPAQFLVGDVEPLLDDSVFMAAKWAQAGNEVDLHVVSAACHAFTLIPMGSATEEGVQSLVSFVKNRHMVKE
ncbi:hypothetical protein DOTSEDRAFT_62325 [Dothistroma septosporum NZE10]|uniref:Alpha/beta hydrolase fold-3 domain-containing protein n=1 Tax=Dothistroma septosporum (strain NZE10 / CBS 128990) TaxID=675120 RepID=N1PJP2_DOTSN|nr:hypothetical protein DOTSEDRAFT_62325 [Dothistroma septosporum NZE10]